MLLPSAEHERYAASGEAVNMKFIAKLRAVIGILPLLSFSTVLIQPSRDRDPNPGIVPSRGSDFGISR